MRFRSKFNIAYWDTAWLLCLAVYLFAGIPHISVHPDEITHIFMTGDYAAVFIEHSPEQVQDIFDENGRLYDWNALLHLIEAPLHGYIMGFAWHVAGMTRDDLPENWNWGMDWQSNVERGAMPSDRLLYTTRFASTVLLFGSVLVMFGLGWLFGKRPFAYFASGLYALNPLILFHARRAMHEAPLLMFGLLTILAAALISRKRERGESVSIVWWLTFGLTCGLAVASKHSSLVFIGAAVAWIFVGELSRRDWRGALAITPKLIGAGILSIVLVFVLTPVLWVDTSARLRLLYVERRDSIRDQAQTEDYQPTIQERIEYALTAAFIAPLDIGTRAETLLMTANYRASALAGVPLGNVVGGMLTIAALLGAVAAVWGRLRPPSYSSALSIGLAVFALAFAVNLVLSPLHWQRYYILAVPPMTLLAGMGLHTLIYHLKSALSSRRVNPI